MASIDIDQMILSVIWIIVIIVFCGILNLLIRRSLNKRIGVDKARLISWITIIVVAILLLNAMMVSIFNISLTIILTSLGIVAIAIAFASQQIMQNAIAGILISLDKRIQTNDWVELGGSPNTNIAFVKDIQTLVTTFIDTDGREFLVPNSFLLANKVVNYSKVGVVMVSMGFIIPLDNDIQRIRDLVIDEARNYGKILPWSLETDAGKMQKASLIRDLLHHVEMNKLGPDPFKPVVLIRQITDKGYDLEIRLWSYDIPLRDHIKGDLIERILLRMRRDGFKLHVNN